MTHMDDADLNDPESSSGAEGSDEGSDDEGPVKIVTRDGRWTAGETEAAHNWISSPGDNSISRSQSSDSDSDAEDPTLHKALLRHDYGERMETRGENGDGENGEAMVRVAENDGGEIEPKYGIVSEYEKCKMAESRPRDDDDVAVTEGAITFNEFEF